MLWSFPTDPDDPNSDALAAEEGEKAAKEENETFLVSFSFNISLKVNYFSKVFEDFKSLSSFRT